MCRKPSPASWLLQWVIWANEKRGAKSHPSFISFDWLSNVVAPAPANTSCALLRRLNLNQRFVRCDAVALLDVNADHDAANRGLDFVFHLHGFDHQYAVARFHGFADLGFSVDDGAGHGSRYAALVGRARTAGTG